MWKYLVLVFVIYSTILYGIMNAKKHYILILISFELFLVLVSVLMSIVGILRDDLVGCVSTIFLLTLGASESAISLVLIVLLYKLNGSILVDVVYKLIENDYFYKS